jgi:triosephosphate isomerase
MRIPFIAGNWKMYKTVQDAVVFVKELKIAVKDITDVEIVIAPPFTAVHAVAEAARNSNIGVAAQNVYWEREGAFTGEVAPAMVKEAGAEYVIVGHSERRRLFGETDAIGGVRSSRRRADRRARRGVRAGVGHWDGADGHFGAGG